MRLISEQCQTSFAAMLKANPKMSPAHKVEDFVVENYMDRILDIRREWGLPGLKEVQREYILKFWDTQCRIEKRKT